MRRIDWRLVPPLREGVSNDEGLSVNIDELLDGVGNHALDEGQQALLTSLEDRLAAVRLTSCEAVSAPHVGDDPDWQARVLDEYADSETDLEMEAYLEARSLEPDCERCPYASPYSVYPMDPCEFSASGFGEILLDPQLARRLEGAMNTAEMEERASELEVALQEGAYRPSRVVDARDYLGKAILFLRFWSSHAFGIQPETFEGLELPTPAPDPEDEDGPPTVH